MCPSAHTGRQCVSVCVRQHTWDVRGCPSVQISARWSLDSARWPFPWTVWVILAQVACMFSTHKSSAGVRQHTQDVCGCPCVSLCVRQYTQDVRGCMCLSVCVRQHTHDVRGCPCVSVCVRQHTQDIRGCPSVQISARWSLESAC